MDSIDKILRGARLLNMSEDSDEQFTPVSTEFERAELLAAGVTRRTYPTGGRRPLPDPRNKEQRRG